MPSLSLSRSYDRLTLVCDCTSCIKNSQSSHGLINRPRLFRAPPEAGDPFMSASADGVMDGMEPEQTQIIYRLHITDLVWGGREPYNRVYKEIHADRPDFNTRTHVWRYEHIQSHEKDHVSKTPFNSWFKCFWMICEFLTTYIWNFIYYCTVNKKFILVYVLLKNVLKILNISWHTDGKVYLAYTQSFDRYVLWYVIFYSLN